MAAQFEGVRPASESSIEIEFFYDNTVCRERLRLKPTPNNLNKASKYRKALLQKIESGAFDYATEFPNSRMANGATNIKR